MTLELERQGYSVRALANWVLDYADRLGFTHTNMGINKLTFFAVESLLVQKHVLITNAKIEAWEHGPVFRELYQSFKQYGNGPITGRARYFSALSSKFVEAQAHFSNEVESFLRDALSPLIACNAAELRELSHKQDGAWHKVWWYEGHANPGMEITPSLLIEIHQGKHVEEAEG